MDFVFFSGVKIRQKERSETQRPPGLGAVDAILVGLINAHENDFSPFDWGQAWADRENPKKSVLGSVWGGQIWPIFRPESGNRQISSNFVKFRQISTNFTISRPIPGGLGYPTPQYSQSRRSTLGARSTIDDGCSIGTSPAKHIYEICFVIKELLF